MSVGFTQSWLPELDSQLSIRDLDQPEPDWSQVARCAGSRLSYSQSIQLNRIIRKWRDPERTDVRILILSSDTCQQLAVGIENFALSQLLHVEVQCGEYGQYRSEVLAPSKNHLAFDPDIVLFSLSAREILAGVQFQSTAGEVDAELEHYLAGIRQTWQHAKDNFDCTVFQQTYVDEFPQVLGNHDALIASSSANVVAKLNSRTCEMAAQDGVNIVDIAGVVGCEGSNSWLSPRHYHAAKMVIGPQATARYGQVFGAQLLAYLGKSKKCLVLDLDNTLWGGEVGDVGVEGVNIGPGNAEGEAFLAFQSYIKTLKAHGVILAACSKNDQQLAKRVFAEHTDMLLKFEDFAAFEANWEPKPQNLIRVANSLNLGLDAIVFVDDSEAERLEVRTALPDVSVPEMPTDPAFFVQSLAAAAYFDTVAITGDDLRRGEQYRAEASRAKSRDLVDSHERFLSSLEMMMTWDEVSTASIQRAAQLVNKTNQFKTTGAQYSPSSLTKIVQASASLALQFRLVDRFGDNGITSVLIGDQDGDKFRIKQWVMSCRVFKRDFEFEIMNVLVTRLAGSNVREIHAEFLPSDRNGVIKDLFRDLSFTYDEAINCWRLAIDEYKEFRTEIKVAAGEGEKIV